MITYPKSIRSKAYPDFIREHATIKKYSNVKKIFPKIGLENCTEDFRLSDYIPKDDYAKMCAGNSVYSETIHVYLNKQFFSNRLSGTNARMQNLLIDDLKIVFSGNGPKAQWDIATMSMRGIDSCQRWGGGYSKALIGSIVDPYTGIIYITHQPTGWTKSVYDKKGSSMIRRSIVRFVADKKTREPAILIERIYPHDYCAGFMDVPTYLVFDKYIRDRTNNKFPIVYGCDMEKEYALNPNATQKYFIPITKPVSELTVKVGPQSERSYRDSQIKYEYSPKYRDYSKLEL
jgi:hypothetical protein